MKKACLGVAALVLCSRQLGAQVYYVSTTGDDSYPGTRDSAFASISKAVGLATPGTTIYVRGGTYVITSTINISRTGKVDSGCALLAFPGERVVIDASGGSGIRGVRLTGGYWHIKGFDIIRAGSNGMIITGPGASHNVIENCSFVGNSNSGLQLDNGASNNQIINCDSYNNADPSQGNADGFAPKLGVGTDNYFYGCRAWQNSDDGLDGYLRPSNNITTTLENCWSFQNGYLSDGTISAGNGNGFKMGGSDSQNLEHNMILKRCLAFDNKAKGFDQNHNKGSMTLLNCTGYNNGGNNYSINETLDSGRTLTLTNCIEFGNRSSIAGFAVLRTNSWLTPFASPSAADFISIDTTGVRGQRKPDGSLPDVGFMHLAPGTQFVDAGTDVGLPFNGSAPDLGCFETDGITSIRSDDRSPFTFTLDQNYPNPFNPETNIKFSVAATGHAVLTVYNLVGQKVVTLFNDVAQAGQQYNVKFDVRRSLGQVSWLSSGAYLCRLESRGKQISRKLLLIK